MGLWKEARAKKLLPLVIQAAAWVKSRKDLDQETSQRWSGGSWTSEFPWCFLSFVGTFGHLFSSVLSKADGLNNGSEWHTQFGFQVSLLTCPGCPEVVIIQPTVISKKVSFLGLEAIESGQLFEISISGWI